MTELSDALIGYSVILRVTAASSTIIYRFSWKVRTVERDSSVNITMSAECRGSVKLLLQRSSRTAGRIVDSQLAALRCNTGFCSGLADQ